MDELLVDRKGLCYMSLATAVYFVSTEPEPVQAQQSKTGKYVPPSLRDGASRRGESMQPNRRGELSCLLGEADLSPSSPGSSCCWLPAVGPLLL